MNLFLRFITAIQKYIKNKKNCKTIPKVASENMSKGEKQTPSGLKWKPESKKKNYYTFNLQKHSIVKKRIENNLSLKIIAKF